MRPGITIVVAVVILVTVASFFGLDYKKQREEQALLAGQMADASNLLSLLPRPPQDLEQRLVEVQQSLATEMEAFPSGTDSTRVINYILKEADRLEIKAIPLLTQPWAVENVGKHDYHVFRLNLAAEGSLAQLTDFVTELESGTYKTLILEELTVSRDSAQAIQGQNIAPESVPVAADINLAFYARSFPPIVPAGEVP